MLFSEPFFLFFFLPVLLFVYFLTPNRYRNLVLSIASLIFYSMGEYRFILWLLGSIAVNYWVAIGLDAVRGTRWSRPLLVLGITSDMGLLLVFKYADFAISNANSILHAAHAHLLPLPHLLLPLGISFFTFHKISYKVDVYRGTAEVRRNPLDLALYILLFPQLIAGPIIRYHDIADQLVKRTIDRPLFMKGIRRFLVGLGKKMIIANTVALCADQIFSLHANDMSTSVAWLGVICYTLQIYFDFSGYSDMAIGLGHMFGFTFLENFNFPYISQSITEFWRRWHMSLSRWFRDYVYIPLGGNRGGPLRTYLNLVTIFFLCGLWHGASWHFVVWGIYHGTFLVIERLGLLKVLERVPRVIRHGYTMLAVVIGWVLFRADTLPQAGVILAAMFGHSHAPSFTYSLAFYLDPHVRLILLIGGIGCLPTMPALTHWLNRTQGRVPALFKPTYAALTASGEALFLMLIFVYSSMLMAADTYNPFIYYRF